ncbi:hypothetical protein [Nocardia terpenica]|uniref:Uncharacterized protein n=1 Tax=Nocardia terpenica TaxID=455432 RepID=A0A164K1B2_9NOCA|nr:hypothetical protein [Nocardia terpenica]KZM70924.1 hypothetical protein AWN90_41090 [Nocardia terpenica]NQE89773.1 hypothetical protein [Nocardia terpenica]
MTETGTARRRSARLAGRIAITATVAAAPLLTAAAASADPAPIAGVPAASTPGAALVDYDDWYHWHCQVLHEWWRPRCHPEIMPPVLPPTGSS